jgi:hypothetical protein
LVPVKVVVHAEEVRSSFPQACSRELVNEFLAMSHAEDRDRPGENRAVREMFLTIEQSGDPQPKRRIRNPEEFRVAQTLDVNLGVRHGTITIQNFFLARKRDHVDGSATAP